MQKAPVCIAMTQYSYLLDFGSTPKYKGGVRTFVLYE